MNNEQESVVLTTKNCVVILDDFGFYVRCFNCKWCSENFASKYTARGVASIHDEVEHNGR